MSNVPIRSWRAASKYCGVPLTTLRDAVDRGEVVGPVTGAGGRSEFDVAALEAYRAERGQAAPPPGAAEPPSPASGRVNAATATPSESAPPAPMGSIAPWMAAAVIGRDRVQAAEANAADSNAHEDDDDDAGQVTHQPPFWTTGTGVEPSYPSGVPRVDPTTLQIFYTPEPVTAGHTPGSAGAVVQRLQAQVAELEQQLAATAIAWRRECVAAIAAEIAVEAIMTGSLPQVAMAARDAAVSALMALSNEDLRREDGYAITVARSAAMAEAQRVGATIAWQAFTWQAHAPQHDRGGYDGDEVARMRAMRRRSRSRSPRW